MAACDVFALGSKWEGLPVALMEASALGLPIVATRVGGIPDAFHDGADALLVAPGSPGALADGIERVITDANLATRLGAAASARASDFDVASAITRLEAIYSRVARR
jgi:glycosyltransferase involved in cell wall biosynthesis